MGKQQFKTPSARAIVELREKETPIPSVVEMKNAGFSDLQGINQSVEAGSFEYSEPKNLDTPIDAAPNTQGQAGESFAKVSEGFLLADGPVVDGSINIEPEEIRSDWAARDAMIDGTINALPGEIEGWQIDNNFVDPETQNPYIVNVRDNHGFLLFQYDASKNQILIKRRAKTNENIPAAVYKVDMRQLASVGNRNIISDNPTGTFVVSETV